MEDDEGGAALLRLLRAVEGKLRYREVTEDIEGASFKYRIAEIDAIQHEAALKDRDRRRFLKRSQ